MDFPRTWKQLPFYYQVHSLLLLPLSYISSPPRCQTKDNLKQRETERASPMNRWQTRQRARKVGARETAEEGNLYVGMITQAPIGVHVSVTDLMWLPVALSKKPERRKLRLLSVSKVCVSYSLTRDAIGVCRLWTRVATRLHLIDYYGDLGAEDTLLKIKRSGDV